MHHHIEAFSIGLHHAVFDSVVDHFHEMAGSGRSGMQVALFGGAAYFVAPRRAVDVADTWSKSFENRFQAVERFIWPPIIRQ